jgi:hypothetical protein
MASAQPLATTETQTISIRTLTGQIIPVQLPLDPTLTVANLKFAIEQEKGIPVDHQRLIFRGAELQDSATLVSVGIEHECAVHLLLRRVEQPVVDGPGRPSGADYGTGQPGMIPVAIPIHDQMGVMAPPMIYPQHERLITVYRLGRAVKLFAIIDGIFLLIFALTYWLLALAIVLPICGYYGAQQYRRCYIYMYMLYLVGNVGLRVYFITQATVVVWMLIFVVGIIIELYIMKIVWNFDKLIKDLTDEDKRELQFLQNPHRRLP